ncbi:MAG: hypothetical protein FJ221_11890 [Lentisphaerae bacterium]|nr:hypothetical protein [Lentisphaerota bacterium]
MGPARAPTAAADAPISSSATSSAPFRGRRSEGAGTGEGRREWGSGSREPGAGSGEGEPGVGRREWGSGSRGP